MPRAEYDAWIPQLLDDVSIFTFSENKNLCWAFFTRLYLDFSKSIEEQDTIRKKGYRVKAFGTTKNTKSKW